MHNPLAGHAGPTWRLALLVGLAASAFPACSETSFTGRREGTVAVVVGDFDNIQDTFNRLEVDTVRYDAIISTATWVEDEDDFDPPSLTVETLFTSERNRELNEHSSVFVASGARGFGARKYNSLQPDDMIISNPEAVENAAGYVRGGGVMVVTDWAYDLVERAFPDSVEFLGDDEVLDAAQRGDIGRYQAKVVDESLRTALDLDEDGNLAVDMDFSNWAVMQGINENDDRVKTWITGDITYRDESGEGTRTLEDVPLLVTIDTGGEFNGRLVYSSFHLDAQNPTVVDTLLAELVGDFDLSTVVRDPGSTE